MATRSNDPRGKKSASRRRKAAFTLIELVVSMAIMTVLTLGMGSAMLLAARALPAEESAFRHQAEAATAVQQMVTELHTASAIVARSPLFIEFQVHDRNGDSMAETIRYQWSGAAGANLLRRYNGGLGEPVANDVRQFDLTYRTRTTSTQITPAPNESQETLLVSNDSTSDLADLAIQSDRWIGQYFRPALPADTVSWKVTRAKIFALPHAGTDGISSVQLQTPNLSNLPSGTILDSRTMLESALLATNWQEFSFNNAAGLSPTQGLCLLVQFGSGSGAVAQVRYRSKNVTLPNAARLEYGGTWSAYASSGLLFYVWGTVTTQAAPQIVQAYQLTEVGVSLQLGDDPASGVSASVETLNRLDVSGI